MNRSDFLEKSEGMIEEGVKKGTYKKTEDITLQDLEKKSRFFVQEVLYIQFMYRNLTTVMK